MVQFDSLLTTPVFNTTSTTLYNRTAFPGSSVCQDLAVVGSTLYILAGNGFNSTVLRGSITGSTPLVPLFTIFDPFPV